MTRCFCTQLVLNKIIYTEHNVDVEMVEDEITVLTSERRRPAFGALGLQIT